MTGGAEARVVARVLVVNAQAASLDRVATDAAVNRHGCTGLYSIPGTAILLLYHGTVDNSHSKTSLPEAGQAR